MLGYFLRSPTRLRQLRRGPLGEHLDGLATELRRHGYTMSTARRILPIAGRFSRFLELAGVTDVTTINESLTARFVNEELGAEGLYHSADRVIACLLGYLRGQGISPRSPVAKPGDQTMRSWKRTTSICARFADWRPPPGTTIERVRSGSLHGWTSIMLARRWRRLLVPTSSRSCSIASMRREGDREICSPISYAAFFDIFIGMAQCRSTSTGSCCRCVGTGSRRCRGTFPGRRFGRSSTASIRRSRRECVTRRSC